MRLNRDPIFSEAAADYRYLLNRGFARESALDLVGNRYQLPREQRDLLRRGVIPDRTAAERAAKLKPLKAIAGAELVVDGHNVLITLESALAGGRLVLADDRIIRDIARSSRNHVFGPRTDQALNLILDVFKRYRPAGIDFLFDAPVSHSGRLAERIGAVLGRIGLPGRARAVPGVDARLKNHPGLIATSDGPVIDASVEAIDLAGRIIARRLKPEPGKEAGIIATKNR